MFQKFYTDTLGSRYIKSLLSQTPIPHYTAVVDGEPIIAGSYYVYKIFIIKCVSSGFVSIPVEEKLYPSDTLYPSNLLFVGNGKRVATFKVIGYANNIDDKTHGVYHSRTNYYDAETHYHLGRYLRYLRTTTNLNLFPFYNCYNNTYFSDTQLSYSSERSVEISRQTSTRTKVVAVPILFGRTYSIYVDSPTSLLLRACVHDNSGYILEDILPNSLSSSLQSSGRYLSHASFKNPIKFIIEAKDSNDLTYEKDLYLLIQLSSENNSSIVVLENVVINDGVMCDKNSVRIYTVQNLSLLRMNSYQSYAFSSRLLEYLLGNPITHNEIISENIEKVQSSLKDMDEQFRAALQSKQVRHGVWSPAINQTINKLVINHEDDFLLDQDGNVNNDVEKYILSKGGNY